MEVLKNEVESGNWLEIKAEKDESLADVAIFAQEWLEENYDDDEYYSDVKDTFFIEQDNIWRAKYSVYGRKI